MGQLSKMNWLLGAKFSQGSLSVLQSDARFSVTSAGASMTTSSLRPSWSADKLKKTAASLPRCLYLHQARGNLLQIVFRGVRNVGRCADTTGALWED